MNAIRKAKKETPEQTVARWIAGAMQSVRMMSDVRDAGFQCGMTGSVVINDGFIDLHYERFDMPGGGYVVVEWDADGNTAVAY